MPNRPRLAVLANVRSTRYSPELAAWLEPLRERHAVRLVEIDEPERFSEQILAEAERSDAIGLASGDGTVARSASALRAAKRPVALIPLGNANDLARGLGLPTDAREACERLATALPVAIDAGRVNGHYFFSAATIGLGTEVSSAMDVADKKRWRRLSYLPRFLAALRRRRGVRVRIRSEGRTWKLRSIQLTVGNGRTIGGGLVIDPETHLRDAELTIASLRPVGVGRLLSLVPTLLSGSHRQREDVDAFRAERFALETSRRVDIATDGDVVTRTPARFETVPGAVRFLVPMVPEPGIAVGSRAAVA